MRGIESVRFARMFATVFAVLALSFGAGFQAVADDEPMEAEAAQADEGPQTEIAPRERPRAVEEITVTGSYLRGTSEVGPSPVTVFQREDIEAIPTTQLTEVTSRLPQNTGGEYQNNIFDAVGGGTAALNLRGLGLGTTLVLIDGRRAVLSGAVGQDGSSFVDINAFPKISIERVEILKEGAAAIYGSDAVAGVVNYITRRDFEGFEVTGSYQWTPEGHSAQRSNFEGIYGWGNERTHFTLGGAFYQQNKYGTTHNSLTDPQFFGSGSTGRPDGVGGISSFGNPGAYRADFQRDAEGNFLRTADGALIPFDIVADDGVSDLVLFSRGADQDINYSQLQDGAIAILDGFGINFLLDPDCGFESNQDGRPQGGGNYGEIRDFSLGIPFLKGAGLCTYSYMYAFDLQYKQKRYNTFSTFSHDFNENLEFYAEGHYYRLENDKVGLSPSFPYLQFPVIPAHNPGNPFNVPVTYFGRTNAAAYPPVDGDGDGTSWRTIAGIRGAVPSFVPFFGERSWDYELSLVHSRSTGNSGYSDVIWPRAALAFNGLAGVNCDVNSVIGASGLPLEEGGIRAVLYDNVLADIAGLTHDEQTDFINGGLTGIIDPAKVVAARAADFAADGIQDCLYQNPFATGIPEVLSNIPTDTENVNTLGWPRGDANLWMMGGDGYGGEHNQRVSTTTTLKMVDFLLRGDVWDAPWGGVSMALGYHFRQEEYDVKRNLGQERVQMYVFIGTGDRFTSQEDTQAVFAEIATSPFESVELQAAVRWEDYGGFLGSSVDPKIAARWQISDWLAARASVSTTFRVPTLSQRFSNRTSLQDLQDGLARDACLSEGRADCPDAIGGFRAGDVAGSNTLSPEDAVTFNGGLILNPIEGLNIAIDYWRIKFDGLVVQQSFQQVLNAETAITGPLLAAVGCTPALIALAKANKVQRDPIGCNLQRIAAQYVNAGSVLTDGVDLSVTYDYTLGSLGDLRASFDGAHIIQYFYKGDENSACGLAHDAIRSTRKSCDIAGSLNRNAPTRRPLPKFKFNASMSWLRDNQRATLTYRHISPYESDWDNSALIGTKISAYNVWDLIYSRDIQDRYTVTLGVNNMFDQDPPAVHGFDLQYDSRTHDPFGRMMFASFKYAFD